MTYKLNSTEMTQADDLHEGAPRSRTLHTGYSGLQESEPGSSASASKARGKGKSREENYDEIGNHESKENNIAVTDHQNNVLNKKKSELRATELLNEVVELRKDVGHLAKMVAEIGISLPTGSNQAHGRSGVDSARKTLNEMEELRKDVSQLAKMVVEINEMIEVRKEVGQLAKTVAEIGPLPTGRNQAHGRSGVHSARKTVKIETGEPSPSGGSGSRGAFLHVRHMGKHQGSHRAGVWGTGYPRPHGW